MEQSAEVEGNQQKVERLPLITPPGSLIRIDSIYIDLAGAMDNQQDTSQCEHFSIREYAAEMRKKDITVCLPFPADDNQIEFLEKTSNILPHIDVVKYKWWRCYNCLREIGAACRAQEIAKVPDSSPSGFLSKDSCSLKEHLNDAAMGENALACAESNKDETLTLSRGHDMEKKDNVGQSIADDSENDACHQKLTLTKDVINSKLALIPERHADGPDASGKNISGNMDLCEPSIRGHISSKNTPLESNKSSSIDVGQKIISNSPKSQQRMDIEDCEIVPKVGAAGIEDINVNKGRTNISHSLDDLSSESSNGFAKNDHHDKSIGSSSKSIRQRAQKVRLLTDILGSSGNVEMNQIRIADSDFDSASDFGDDMSVRANSKQQSKGKRMMTQFENEKPPLVPKKPQISESNGDYFAKRNCMVIDSDTEESSDTLTKQKNLKEHISSKKKQKQTENEDVRPISIPRPDVAKKYHFAATQEGFSRSGHHLFRNTEMDPYYMSSSSPLRAEQKSDISKQKNNVPVPPWNTMLGEGSFVRKNSDDYMRKGVDFSLNSYDVTQRNKESHISKAKIGEEPPSLIWNSALRCHQVKDGISNRGESSNFRKAAPDLNSGKGLLYDLNEKIASQSPIRDMQNVMPQFGKRTIQHHRELNMHGTRSSEPRNDDRDKGNDNIPTDVVELMAKNQYERRRQEFERSCFSPEQTNEKRKFESMGLSRAHGNGLLKSYQVEDQIVRNLISQKTTVNSNEFFASMKTKPNNSLNFIESRLNMSKMEGGKSAFTRCNSFSNNQGTQSGRVSYPGYGSSGNGYQNFQWRNDRIGTNFSPPPEARYSPFPNYTNFPQNYAPRASYFGTNSQIFEGSSRGKMAQGFDLNYMNEKYSKLREQDKEFGIETLRKSSDFDLFASKHRENEFSSRVSGSLDLNSNETIPAILLSLKDAGMKSNPNLSLDGKRKLISKPFASCDYHPKVLDNPIFISDHDPKEAFGRDIGVSSNSSRPSSFTSYMKNQWSDNSYVRPPPLPESGPFPSSFRSDKSNSKEGNEIPTRVPLKFGQKKKGPAQNSAPKLKIEEKKKGPAQNSGRKLQKRAEYRTSVSKNNNASNSIQINERGNQPTSRTDYCSVNRNPADFSIPEPGNVYMISAKDLKLGKKYPRKKRGSANVDGNKRQRMTVPEVPETQ